MNKVKDLLERAGTKAKFAVGTLAAAGTTALATVAASAEEGTGLASSAEAGTGLASYSTQITEQFTNTANDVIPIIIGVLGAGLGIFAIFVGIKLAKKMFSTVSKG